jgi:outer membrane protein assembly factor BamB
MKKILLFFLILSSGLITAEERNLVWKFQTNGRVYSSPVIVNDIIIAGSGDSSLYAIDKKRGVEKWRFKTKGAVNSTPSVHGSKAVFSSTDGLLYAVNINTGKLEWVFESGGEKIYDMWDYYLSSPIVSNGIVFWGSGDNHLYAIDGESGNLKWKFKASGIIHATPAVDENTLYFGDFDGYLYSLNVSDGLLNWSFRTIGDNYFPKGEIQKGLIIDGQNIYFGSRDYNVYAVNKKTGRGVWNLKEGSWVISTPAVNQNRLFYGTSDTHEFVCLDKTSGKKLWSNALPMRVYGSAIIVNEIIYFGCFDGILRGLNINNGELKWMYQTSGSRENYSKVFDKDGKFNSGFELYGKDYIESERIIHTLGSILSTPVMEDDIIYFGSSDGGIYAVRINAEGNSNHP